MKKDDRSHFCYIYMKTTSSIKEPTVNEFKKYSVKTITMLRMKLISWDKLLWNTNTAEIKCYNLRFNVSCIPDDLQHSSCHHTHCNFLLVNSLPHSHLAWYQSSWGWAGSWCWQSLYLDLLITQNKSSPIEMNWNAMNTFQPHHKKHFISSVFIWEKGIYK